MAISNPAGLRLLIHYLVLLKVPFLGPPALIFPELVFPTLVFPALVLPALVLAVHWLPLAGSKIGPTSPPYSVAMMITK